MEKLGKETRDILDSPIKDLKKDQQQAKEQIKTTLESFQELTGFQGGSRKSYKELNDEWERSHANRVRDRIHSSDQAGNGLFSKKKSAFGQRQAASKQEADKFIHSLSASDAKKNWRTSHSAAHRRRGATFIP